MAVNVVRWGRRVKVFVGSDAPKLCRCVADVTSTSYCNRPLSSTDGFQTSVTSVNPRS